MSSSGTAVEKGVAAPAEMNVEQFGYQQELKRALSVWDVVYFGMVMAIPLAPFLIFGYLYQLSEGMIAGVYAVTCVMMLFTANSYAWMASEFPLAGSAYNYVSRGASNAIGTLAGFGLTLEYLIAPASLYVFAAYALGPVLPDVPFWIWIVGFVVVNVILNVIGISFTATVNKVFLAWQLIMLAWFAFAVISAAMGGGTTATFTTQGFYRPEVTLPVIIAGVGLATYNFIGVDATSTLAEETKGGYRTIGLGMLIATFAIGAIFVLLGFLGSMVYPDWASLPNADTALYDAALSVGGEPLQWGLTLCLALTAGIACCGCAQAATARTWYGMSRDGVLPGFFSIVHKKYKTPWVNIVLVGIISAILGLTISGEMLSNFICFGSLFAFTLVNLAAFYYFIVRKRSSNYLLHGLIPLVGAGFTGWAWLSLKPEALVLGFSWLGLGVLYFLYLKFIKKVKLSFDALS